MSGGTVRRLFATGAPARRSVEARSLHALAVLLLFVQLPHLAHLPPWTSALAATLVGLRLHDLHRGTGKLRAHLLSPFALAAVATLAAVGIHADYGYFLGRDPCVAFLAVLVAAKFAEVRRSGDTTLLLCLAAFLLLTRYFYSQTILAAAVTLPAVLALAHALVVLRDPHDPAPVGPRLRLAAKLLVQGVPLAALLFVVFPRLPGPIWSLPEDSLAQSGLSDSMEPGSIGALSQSDAVAFRVEFDTPPPPPRERYWRGPVFERFDGRRWSAGITTAVAHAPATDTATAAVRLDYTVMLQPHRRRWLFALEQPVSLPRASEDAAGRTLAQLTRDGQLLAAKPVTRVLRYRQSSRPGTTLAARDEPAPATRALAGRNPRTVALAKRLAATAPDDAAYAARVLERFTQAPYRYTLEPGQLGDAPVDEFLFDTRAGFCEHYASAFVVLMRAAGIPARVVTGYLGGEMNADYMIVRQADAHAWAEAWIDGAWRRFDPTGAVAPSRIETGLAAALPDSDAVPRLARGGDCWWRLAGLRWDAANHAWQRLVVDFDDAARGRLLERLGLDRPAPWQLVAGVLAVTGLWCLFVLGFPGRRTAAGLAPAEHLWRRFATTLARRGVERRTVESPGEFVRRAARVLPDERERIERIGHGLIALRFAPQAEAQGGARLAAIRRDWRRFALVSRVRPRR